MENEKNIVKEYKIKEDNIVLLEILVNKEEKSDQKYNQEEEDKEEENLNMPVKMMNI